MMIDNAHHIWEVGMKFSAGSDVDSDHCIALTHEYFRCDDAFKQFTYYGEKLILEGHNREAAYRAYNAYSDFVHHLYEFIQGAHARDAGNTRITDKKEPERCAMLDGYVQRHAQRVMDIMRDAIREGTAPSWVNHISCYDVTVPTDFAKDFREYRNKVIGHVSYERASKLSLTTFYHKYHKYLYSLYRDSAHMWGRKDGEFPDLKEITEFSLMIQDDSPASPEA